MNNSKDPVDTYKRLLQEAWAEIEEKDKIILSLRSQLDKRESARESRSRRRKSRKPYEPLSTQEKMVIHEKCVRGVVLSLRERAFVARGRVPKKQIQQMSETEFRNKFVAIHPSNA